jgi:putative membrane protein
MMWGNDDGRWRMHEQSGTGWIMVVMMLILVIAIVVAVFALLRWQAPTAAAARVHAPAGAVDARRILQERFARGEIDEQDFRSRIQALEDTEDHGS